MTERNQLIDFLRGFSIITIILTHANAFFLSDKLAFTLWNLSQFSVPVFIFCSVYLFIKKNQEGYDLKKYFSYLKKRFLRLLVPYYIFLFFFLIALFIFTPQVISIKYIWQSLLVIGGVDINWLVLLFLYLTIILPFFVWSLKKSKVLFWTFFILSLGSSIYFLFLTFNLSYKFIMWLPWSLMFYFTYLYIKLENSKKGLIWFFVFNILFFVFSYWIQGNSGHDLVFRNNKYPPNIFYITFGTAAILGFSLLSQFIIKNNILMSIFNFFSKHSYSIYFIHYTVLTILVAFMIKLNFNWISLFLCVVLVTVTLQKIFIWTMPLRPKGLR